MSPELIDHRSMTTLPSALPGQNATEIQFGRTERAEALRYLIASVVALAADAGVLALVVERMGMTAWAGGAVAYLTGLIVIYFLSVRWVFLKRTEGNRMREFAVFAALGLFGLVLNSTTLFLATTAGLALPFAKVLSAGLGFLTNFVTRKVMLFSGGNR